MFPNIFAFNSKLNSLNVIETVNLQARKVYCHLRNFILVKKLVTDINFIKA